MADTPRKAAPKAPTGRPFVKGDARINRTKPGTGRPPSVFKDFLRTLRESPEARAALELAMTSASGRNFGNAWKIATDYDDEKPAEKSEAKMELVIKIEREGRRITR